MSNILVFGATSAIAQETARLFAAAGDALYLVARNAERLNVVADDLRVRGARQAETEGLDANDTDAHEGLVRRAEEALGGLDTVLVAHGTLGDQAASEADFAAAEAELRTNFLSVVSLLTHVANRFERQRRGRIAVISSVAGDRGRKSNYVYGTAKGALTIFLQGLRNRLHAAGVQVTTIKPGFVDTPMTAHIADKGPLFATPQQVARGIHRAIEQGRDVVYVPWFWWGIMTVIRAIPETVFKRLSL